MVNGSWIWMSGFLFLFLFFKRTLVVLDLYKRESIGLVILLICPNFIYFE